MKYDSIWPDWDLQPFWIDSGKEAPRSLKKINLFWVEKVFFQMFLSRDFFFKGIHSFEGFTLENSHFEPKKSPDWKIIWTKPWHGSFNYPILRESILIQIYGRFHGFPLLTLHCLGRCRIMSPVWVPWFSMVFWSTTLSLIRSSERWAIAMASWAIAWFLFGVWPMAKTFPWKRGKVRSNEVEVTCPKEMHLFGDVFKWLFSTKMWINTYVWFL